MKTINEVSKISGVSKRTLQYYDKIGLLPATDKTDANYRLYDDSALQKLQAILLFKELGFSLKEIKEIINNPDFDVISALISQKELLNLQKERLNRLIDLTDSLIRKENKMSFNAFNKDEINKYKNEVKEKWGNTDEYKEYTEKHCDKNGYDADLMNIFKKFGKLKTVNATKEEKTDLIKELQKHITDNYYTCSNEMLKNLGLMYVSDERFKNNIDSVGGKGTAEYVNNAIKEILS